MCASLMSDGKGAVLVENMRPTINSAGAMTLVPACAPTDYTLPQGWKPLARLLGSLLMSNGSTVGSLANNMALIATGELMGEARCCLNMGDKLLVMADGGASYATAAKVEAARRDYHPISLYSVDDVTLSAAVDTRTLSRTYTTGLFDKKDRDALIGDLSEAYRRLCADAAVQGAMIQPALAHYRLLDSRGDILFESAPVLLTHSSGAQCTENVALTSPDRVNINAYSLAASTWHLEVGLPSDSGSDVAMAEILMTPLFHPYDPSMEGTASLGRAGSSASTFAHVGLPGRERGLGTSYRTNARRIIMDAIARIEQLEERVAVINAPFSGDTRTVKIDIAVNPDPAADSSRIKSVLAKKVKSHSYADTMLRQPHTFSAGAVASSSGAVAWGNISVKRFVGYSPAIYAASAGSGAWNSISTVHFKGNKGVMRHDSGLQLAPAVLSPVICYPAPDAREIDIVCYYSGSNHRRTFGLSPEASGRYAVFIADDLRPFSLPACSPTVSVSAEEEVIDFADTVAFAPAATPLDIAATVQTSGTVISLAGRSGSDQSWDFGRSRFTIGCTSSIYSAGVNLSSGVTGLRTILSRGILRPDAMAVSDDGEVYIAGDGITILPRSGSSSKITTRNDYPAVGYDSRSDELWALRADGTADVFCRRFGWGYFRMTCVNFERFENLGGLCLSADRKLFDPGVDSDAMCNVTIILKAAPSRRYGDVRPLALYLTAQGSDISGTLTAEGSSVGDLRPWLVRRADIDGTLAGPLRMALSSRGVRTLKAELRATVSRDFIFDSFTFAYL